MKDLIMDKEQIKAVDIENMFDIIRNFPGQAAHAREIGKKAPIFNAEQAPLDILILGMGGSAIGGDLVRSYCSALNGASHLRITINRNYDIPGWVDKDTFVIASSYSGGTEETISAFEQAMQRTKHLLCICSGGELEIIARSENIPVIKIPGGFQPRCALGYSFIILLYVLMRSEAMLPEAVHTTERGLDEAVEMLNNRAVVYSQFNADNRALKLAEQINTMIPVIYSSGSTLDTVNLRWRGQIQENAKYIAFGNLLPEMNHNEINGWELPDDIQSRFVFLFLKDINDHHRVKIRQQALKRILSEKKYPVIELESRQKYFVARMLDLIYMADWTSYYLALMNHKDPTAIPLITLLKNTLAAAGL